MLDGNGEVVYEHIKNTNDQAAFLLFSSKKPDEIPYFNNFPERKGSDFFIHKSEGFNHFKEKILQITQHELIFLRKQLSFKKIRIYNFWKFNTALCDIFLRLSDSKYVKIIKGGDRYTRKDIEKYVHKQQKFLYIRSDDFSSFAVTLGKTPFLTFNQDEDNISEIKKPLAYRDNKLQRLYFSDYVAGQFLDYLPKEDQSNKNRFTIITTLDEKLQKIAEDEMNNFVKKNEKKLWTLR